MDGDHCLLSCYPSEMFSHPSVPVDNSRSPTGMASDFEYGASLHSIVRDIGSDQHQYQTLLIIRAQFLTTCVAQNCDSAIRPFGLVTKSTPRSWLVPLQVNPRRMTWRRGMFLGELIAHNYRRARRSPTSRGFSLLVVTIVDKSSPNERCIYLSLTDCLKLSHRRKAKGSEWRVSTLPVALVQQSDCQPTA